MSSEPITTDPTQPAAEVLPGTVLIHVTDKNGSPAVAATVTLGGQTMPTDDKGDALFSGIAAGQELAQVTYKGDKSQFQLTVQGTAGGEKFSLTAAASKQPLPMGILIGFGSVFALFAAAVYVLRRRLLKLVGSGHARPIKALVGVSLILFFVSLIGIFVADLLS